MHHPLNRAIRRRPPLHGEQQRGRTPCHAPAVRRKRQGIPAPLARGRKLEQFINRCIRDGLTDHLQLAVHVGMTTEPALIWRKILEAKQMQPIEVSEDTWKVIDELFRMSPRAPETLPSLQETLAEHERRGEVRGEILAHQRILVDQLRRKLHELPDAARQKIEATEDREQLRRWAEGVVEAQSLDEMGLGE